MKARIVQKRKMEFFSVNTEVQKGCALAPVISNVFLFLVSFFFHHTISAADSVPIRYRIDGSLL